LTEIKRQLWILFEKRENWDRKINQVGAMLGISAILRLFQDKVAFWTEKVGE